MTIETNFSGVVRTRAGIQKYQQIKIIFHQKFDVAEALSLKGTKYNIAIFDTFKTRKDKFTGEAKRQRGIIAHLASEQSPELCTRTSIAHVIAKNMEYYGRIFIQEFFETLTRSLFLQA